MKYRDYPMGVFEGYGEEPESEPVTVRVPLGEDAPPTVRFSGRAYHEVLERQLYEDIVDEGW